MALARGRHALLAAPRYAQVVHGAKCPLPGTRVPSLPLQHAVARCSILDLCAPRVPVHNHFCFRRGRTQPPVAATACAAGAADVMKQRGLSMRSIQDVSQSLKSERGRADQTDQARSTGMWLPCAVCAVAPRVLRQGLLGARRYVATGRTCTYRPCCVAPLHLRARLPSPPLHHHLPPPPPGHLHLASP